jgi:putative ABC transport system substrate-binding protein
MDRRKAAITMLGFATCAASTRADAQPAARPRRVGVLSFSNPVVARAVYAPFTDELVKLGWVEGQNLQMTYRYAGGDVARLPALAAELVAVEPDVLFSTTAPGSLALARATSRIPIVMSGAPDPVALGLVKSLPRPGGNVTGTASSPGQPLHGKRLEILKEWLPRLARVAVIFNLRDSFDLDSLAALQGDAGRIGLRVDALSVGNLSEFRSAIDALRRDPPDAIYVLGGAFNYTNRDMICTEALRMRVPTMATATQFADSGCLPDYGSSLDELERENARFVDQILRGANPADMPVRQPTRFELDINARTAASLGLAIPPKLRVMADRVIE